VHALAVSLDLLEPFLAVAPPPTAAGPCTHGGVLETVLKILTYRFNSSYMGLQNASKRFVSAFSVFIRSLYRRETFK